MKTITTLVAAASIAVCACSSKSDGPQQYKTQEEAMRAAHTAALADLKLPADRVTTYFVCRDGKTRLVLVAQAGKQQEGSAALTQGADATWSVTQHVEDGSYPTGLCQSAEPEWFVEKIGGEK